MNQILKHSFEAVSLLTTDNGMLDVTIIPAANQPDWIIPSSLILSIDNYAEHVRTYLWAQQEVAVFHLMPQDQPIDKTIVLEGNTVLHRLALQTAGELQQMKVRISDVKDAQLPERYTDVAAHSAMNSNDVEADNKNYDNTNRPPTANSNNDQVEAEEVRFQEDVISSYMFQTITINDTPYLIPDLDKIVHQLVDLDS